MAANNEGVNNKKSTHDTFNYGTPNIYPLVITRTDEGNFTGHELNNSDFHKVLNYMQTRGVEIYGIGEVSGTQFTVLVNWNTLAQDNTDDENLGYPNIADGDLDYLENEISNALGISVTIYHGKIVADDIGYNNDC
jgi:hypothetical protein